MSLETLQFLQQLLKGASLPFEVQEFPKKARIAATAYEELEAAVAEAQAKKDGKG